MNRPVVLAIGGHDPTGGAGIQADIEAITALGGYPITLPTALTVQSTKRVHHFEPTPTHYLEEQATLLLEEFPVAAIKIGMVGSTASCHTLQQILQPHREIPLILDPVLAGGGGGSLSGTSLAQQVRQTLLPLSTLATPNRSELQQLVPEEEQDIERCNRLFQEGSQALLVTGTDTPSANEPTDQVHHTLFQPTESTPFQVARLPHHYHGSGCTLASAIATQCAFGKNIKEAVSAGLTYTQQTLLQAIHPTKGQHLPNRFCHWETTS